MHCNVKGKDCGDKIGRPAGIYTIWSWLLKGEESLTPYVECRSAENWRGTSIDHHRKDRLYDEYDEQVDDSHRGGGRKLQ